MAEYIKREAAVKAVEKYGLTNGVAWGRHTGLAICIASEIADIPAADVAPVVHGRWINGRCSNCGVDIPTDDAHDAIFEEVSRVTVGCRQVGEERDYMHRQWSNAEQRANYAEAHPGKNLWAWVKRKLGCA